MERNWSKKRILLVYPEIPKATYWSFSTALQFIDKRSSMPPLGLATVAAMLPEEYELKLRDLNVESLTDDDLEWAEYVFISAMVVQKESMEEVIARVRERGLPIIAGGPYPSTCYEDVDGVDHFVIGEAEGVLGRFLEDFDAGRARIAYARPVREQEANAIREYFGEGADVEIADRYSDIDEAPVPRFDLFTNPNYYQSMALQTSRGCPIGCEFCDIWRRFGKKSRSKSYERLEVELDALYEMGWTGSVFIVDDNFIGHKGRAKELLRNMIEWQREHDYPFEFFTEATFTLAEDEELLALMRDAGFDYVFIGIETPSEESLKETRKHINMRGTMSERVARIQGYGIQVSAGFIIGFDNDPDDIAERMVACIQDLGIPTAMVGLLQALPDTDLEERLKREGRLLSGASGNNTHEFSLNFITKRPSADVVRDYKRVLQSIYPPNLKAYFDRCSVLRAEFSPNPNIKQRTSFIHIKALARFMWRSIFRTYRWNCWGFVLSTLVTKPSFFSTACTLAIQGHHFREITRLAFEIERLEHKFSKQLSKVVAKLRKEMEAGYVAGGDRVEKLAGLVEKRRRTVNRYVRRRVDAISRRYGLPVQRTYDEFLGRLESAIREVQIEYGLVAPIPVKA